MSTKVDTYQQPSEPVEGGAVSEGGVSAAWMRLPSPHGRVYGVPALRYRPANPRDASFCFCCCLGLKHLRVQGAALPSNPQCSRAATASRNPAWACPDSGA
ncbi:hypothetical protein DL544_15320 [Stenotrophomonas sp. pho]|nr:hypothetical protein DL544_15320 [Stenotrophomonas sp. pho]